jgi:hypothetical protein
MINIFMFMFFKIIFCMSKFVDVVFLHIQSQVYKSRYLRSTYYVSHAFGELGGVFTIIFGSLVGHYLNSE